MKKTIQATVAILVILFICVGYTSSNTAAENPSIQSSKSTKKIINEAYINGITSFEKNNSVMATKPLEQGSITKEVDSAQGIPKKEGETVRADLQGNENTLGKESSDLENRTGTEVDSTNEASLKRELDKGMPMVALTFDDGPHPKYTAEILESLRENNAVATFFVLGNRAEKYKSTINSIIEGGNELGNHTYDHKELTKLNGKGIESQITRTAEILESITGMTPLVTRPAYGSINDNVKLYAGSPLVLWSIDTMDWKSRNKNKIINKTLQNVKDGDIILMHDIYKSTADAAKVIIRELKAKGYQMVTISELYGAREVTLQKGHAYYKCISKSSIKK